MGASLHRNPLLRTPNRQAELALLRIRDSGLTLYDRNEKPSLGFDGFA